jgi:ATP-dependent RNA helicase DeaD
MHFNQLNIKKSLLQGVEKAKYETMTEVQENIIPAFLEGKDILAKAPTGTGKTAAFAIPSLEKVNTEVKTPQVLILVPTRELAVQTGEEYKKLSSFIPNLKVVTIYGGQKIDVQLKALKYNPQIIASTPGRLIDHVKRKSIDLSHITTIILDEVDEMVNMGFINDIKTIFSLFTNPHQTILISATFSDSVNKISERYQKDPVVFEAKNTLVSEPKITPFYVKINEANKLTFLTKMLKDNP